MCKNFIQNIGLKEHITAVYEERDSIVINVAKILLEDAIWKYLYKMFMKFIQELNCEHCTMGSHSTMGYKKNKINFELLLLFEWLIISQSTLHNKRWILKTIILDWDRNMT